MQADLICIGNELLTGLIENSNAGFLSRRLWASGIPVRESVVVADDEYSIREALERALGYSELVILTGGLGPTDDDLTREAVAGILDLPLVLNDDWLNKMISFFVKRGIKMPEGNKKQAMVLKGSKMLPNKRGTAPGAIIELQGKIIILLPGPPAELTEMFDQQVQPYLVLNNHGIQKKVKTLKCVGLGESMLEEAIKKNGKWDYPPISYVAKGYEVNLQIKASGNSEEADAMIEEAETVLRETLEDYIFGSDEDTITSVVASLFMSEKLTLSVAESCSGGLLSDMITDIPGSSGYYLGGVIAYSNNAKSELLKIDPGLIKKEGEVSKPVATAMAEGVRTLFRSDYGVGITGYASPKSEGLNDNTGLVYVAVSNPNELVCKEFYLGGGRRGVKERAVQVTFALLRKMLVKS